MTLNRVETVIRAGRATPAPQATRIEHQVGRPAERSLRVRVDAIKGDYLVCSVLSQDGTATDRRLYVAKQWILRGSIAARNNETYIYTGTEAQQREATIVQTGGTVVIGTQYVKPSWQVGDHLTARLISNGTGVTAEDDTPVVWEDSSSRAWTTDRASVTSS